MRYFSSMIVYLIQWKEKTTQKLTFCHILKVTSLAYQLQTLTNISDSMAYLTSAPVLGVLSKKNGNNIVPLGGAESRYWNKS